MNSEWGETNELRAKFLCLIKRESDAAKLVYGGKRGSERTTARSLIGSGSLLNRRVPNSPAKREDELRLEEHDGEYRAFCRWQAEKGQDEPSRKETRPQMTNGGIRGQ